MKRQVLVWWSQCLLSLSLIGHMWWHSTFDLVNVLVFGNGPFRCLPNNNILFSVPKSAEPKP